MTQFAVDGMSPLVPRNLHTQPVSHKRPTMVAPPVPTATTHPQTQPAAPTHHAVSIAHHAPQQSTKAETSVRAATKPALARQKRSTVLKRQFVQSAQHAKRQQKQQWRRQVGAFLFGGIAASVVVGLLVTTVISHRLEISHAAQQQKSLGAAAAMTSASISEIAPSTDEISQYRVSSDKPRTIQIPKLQLLARIFDAPADLNGEPVTPKNIFDAGWSTTSATPGEDGVMLLNGQVTGSSKVGIFSRVNELGVGDIIQIERGDGAIYKYKVVRSQQYEADKVDMQAAMQPAIAGKPGLNLLTCTGRYNVKTNQFEKRTLIFAVQQ